MGVSLLNIHVVGVFVFWFSFLFSFIGADQKPPQSIPAAEWERGDNKVKCGENKTPAHVARLFGP